MRKMAIEALYVKPRLSIANISHRKYPYLLRGLVIDRPNQVWTADITYIPMVKGFCYLVAIMDWASRKVLSWRLSNTLDSDFCVDALQEAIDRYDMAAPKYLIPIRAVNLPPRLSQTCFATTTSPSAWMARADGRIMFLSNDSGEASNTKISISRPMPLCQNSGRGCPPISNSTTNRGVIITLTGRPRIWFTSTNRTDRLRHDL